MNETVKVIDCSNEVGWLEGKSFISLEFANGQVLVPYEPNRKYYKKWEKWFLEDNIFDKNDIKENNK